MLRRLQFGLIAALLLAAAAPGASAADFAALRPTGYLNDFARVIRDPAIQRELESYCARVEQATGAQIALVTLPSLEGEPIEDVANLLFRKWGVGDKKENQGVLVLLSIRDRRSRVEVGYGLEPYLTDGAAGSILRGMRPALRQGDYGAALAEAARHIGEKVAAAKGVSIGQAAPRRAGPRPRESLPIPSLLLLALVLFAIFGSLGRRGGGGGGSFLMGMLLGNLLSGGGRYRGGGGFGGYDSGDSFGGFGGGDSGGGGASSDW